MHECRFREIQVLGFFVTIDWIEGFQDTESEGDGNIKDIVSFAVFLVICMMLD